MKNRSTILLDLDGVMIKNKSWEPVELLEDGFCAFDETATKNLNRLISETGACIILTTSHKVKYSVSEWTDIFKNRGIVTDVDKLNTDVDRFSEVLGWFENKSTNNFIILDDDKSLNNLPSAIKCRLVLTSPMIGLTEELVKKSIKLLRWV
jgi:hypothetical protein